MSFGDPNNPYGQQPQAPQGQPGYGYPQQAPQGVPPQGGYAYPQQQAPQGYPGAYPGGPGGYPGVPMVMPGLLKTSRVLLFIIGGLQLIIGLVAGIGGAALSSSTSSSSASTAGDLAGGILVIVGLFVAAGGVLAIFLGAKFAKGGNGIRITTIVYASLSLLGSLGNFANLSADGAPTGIFGGIIGLAIGGVIMASVVSSDGAAWFKRPRY
uniref:Integral membrane protein n=1 Tax=Streptomyces sp. NBC_00049 TaxID=2903617 RepID=A0AAU2JUR2_9ACTN